MSRADNNSFYDNRFKFSNLLGDVRSAGLDKLVSSTINVMAQAGDIDSVKLAIENGEDINEKDDLGRAPIHQAAQYGQVAMVDFLIAHGVNVNSVVQPLGHTALFIAVQRGYFELSRKLIEAGADVNVRDSITGKSLLHLSVGNDDWKMTKLLLESSIDTLIADSNGNTAFELAMKKKYSELSGMIQKTQDDALASIFI